MNRKIAFALAAVLAAGHAMPETKKHLQEAATELKSVATDLEAGNVIAAKRLDASLAKAAHALATWHFYRAKESWGKTEEVRKLMPEKTSSWLRIISRMPQIQPI